MDISHIDVLILTHAHFDHAGNARTIKEKYNAVVIVHKEEADYLSRGENVIPGGTTFVTRHMVNLFGEWVFSKLRYEGCLYDITVDEQFDLTTYGLNARIIHTPGHTPGSMSVIVDDEIALVGDAMFGVFRGSVFPPYACDTKQLIRSWGKLLETGCLLFIPSHGSENRRELVERDYQKRSRMVGENIQ